MAFIEIAKRWLVRLAPTIPPIVVSYVISEGMYKVYKDNWYVLWWFLISVIAVFLVGTIYASAFFYAIVRAIVSSDDSEIKIANAEQRVRDDPDKPQAAWDLARTLLKSYVDRNLAQVQWIFWLTIIVMVGGFCLVIWGISIAYMKEEVKDAAKWASVTAACAGLITEFIGVSLMLIYKSTMAQAQEYMSVLERINAVGMSIQILETMDPTEKETREKTRAMIARELLELYGNKPLRKAKKRG